MWPGRYSVLVSALAQDGLCRPKIVATRSPAQRKRTSRRHSVCQCTDCMTQMYRYVIALCCSACYRAAMQEHDVKFVYVATDTTEDEELRYIRRALGNSLLPRYTGRAGDDKQISAAVEAWICSRGSVFEGTRTSNFSLLIRTLRKVDALVHSQDGDLGGHRASVSTQAQRQRRSDSRPGKTQKRKAKNRRAPRRSVKEL